MILMRCIRKGYCCIVFALMGILFLFCNVSIAQDDDVEFFNYEFNILDKIKVDYLPSWHDSDLFGEKFDNNTGTIFFEYPFVDLPGNFDIEVAYRRSYATVGRPLSLGWRDEVPRIVYQVLDNGRTVGEKDHWPLAFQEELHCSGGNFGANDLMPSSGGVPEPIVEAKAFNIGPNIIIPGQINERIIYNNGALPISPGSYRFTTKSKWRISCIAQKDGVGEGFIATSPQGVTYTFDIARLRKKVNYIDNYYGTFYLDDMEFLATKVEDRFGNWVAYNYSDDGSVLQSITSSDNRKISFATDSSGRRVVTANGNTWLISSSKVTRPDGKSWEFQMKRHDFRWVDEEKEGSSCNLKFYESRNSETLIINKQGTDTLPETPSITIKHPDGAVGKFWLGYTLQGRTNLDMDWYSGAQVPSSSRCIFQYSLLKKEISGVGIDSYVWLYEYSVNYGHYIRYRYAPDTERINKMSTVQPEMLLSDELPSNIDSFNYKWVKVIGPDGGFVKSYINRDASTLVEGSVFAEEHFSATGEKLKEVQNTYVGGTLFGNYFFNTSELDEQYTQTPKLTRSKTLLYDGSELTVYTTDYTNFDAYDVPRFRNEYNSYSVNKRYTQFTYYNDSVNWLLGLPATFSLSENGSDYIMAKQTTYHSETGAYKSLPNCIYSFGRKLSCNESYHADGTLKRLSYNAADYWVEFENYKRGEAQVIKTPSSLSTDPQYAYIVIDDNGWKTKTTDFNGNCTNYEYDKIGRVTLIDPCDSRWANTSIKYTTASGSEESAGVVAGMLIQTITKGSYKLSNYLDGFLRPILSVEHDAGKSSTKRYVNKKYNFDNQLTFTSYPWPSAGYQLGTRYFYDGLKRKVRTEVDTKAGVKVNTATYLAGNRISNKDFKNYVTGTTYLAYGAPTYQQLTEIVAPESVTTKMQYNVFGNMTSVVQGGVTQTNIYDAYQRLCKTVRPDEGNRAFSYNAIGQLSWHAHGASVDGSLTSCDTVVDGLDKTTYIYDNLGNSYRVDYGDDTPDLTYKYDKNNNLKSLEAGATTWAYEYNSLNLVELETLSIDGKSFMLNPSYDSLGHLSAMVYPSGRSLSITANGLGQVTSVGGYVTNATYYPGGSLDTITYGNGVTYSVNLNTRQQPEDAFIKKLDGTFLSNLYYGYDANANVDLIQDYLKPRYTIDMEYDGLNRLVVANGYWGAGSFAYDVLGNIRSKKLGTHSLSYEYDTENRLYTVSGSKDYIFDYDSRGNVVESGVRPFKYNLANQLVKSDGLSYVYDGHGRRVKKNLNGKTSYSVYSSSGKLMYRQKDNGDHVDYLYLGSHLVTSIESR